MKQAFSVLMALVIAASAANAGESPSDRGSSPQPMARVRVSIPPSGGRAEIRDPVSDNASSDTGFSTTASDSNIPPALLAEMEKYSKYAIIPAAPRILATLNGQDITEDEVVRLLLERRGKETLDWLIGREILKHELDRLGLSVGDSEVDERLQKHLEGFRKAFPSLNRPDELTRAASGMRLDEYRERAVWVELALRKIMRIALRPSTEQLRGYYAERQAEFIRPERVRISQVFVAPQPAPEKEGIADASDWTVAERQILEAHSRLKMGEDFSAVARAYGSGGQLSRWVGRGELLRELEEAAFGIGVGSNTTPIKSSMGYHILLVEEKLERKLPPFDEVREEVLAQYEEMQFILLAGEFMTRLRDKALKNGGLVITPEAETFTEPDDEPEREE